jgi:maleylacetate reductase
VSIRRWSLGATGAVYDGPGARTVLQRGLARRGSRRVTLLTNRSLSRTRWPDELAALIPGGATVFSGISANAPKRDVDSATEHARAARADALVAIGGSSVTDAAKIVRLALLGADADADAVPLIVLPTTLSSGELTPAAGMTGEVESEKTYVMDPRMAPTALILDPELTIDTPRELWLSSGVKALDHACEALWAVRPHPYSDALAAEGLARLWRALPACAARPDDLHARLDAQIGGWFSMAGMTRHGPGPSHLLGHQLAARWGIAHGVTSCITLPAVLREMEHEGRPGVARVTEIVATTTAEHAARALESLIDSLSLPRRLRDVGGVEAEIDLVADAAWRHGNETGYAPPDGAATFARLLRTCW